LARQLEIHAQTVQRLFFRKRFSAMPAKIALHREVFIFE